MHQRMWEFRNALKNVGKFPSAPRNVGIANASKNLGKFATAHSRKLQTNSLAHGAPVCRYSCTELFFCSAMKQSRLTRGRVCLIRPTNRCPTTPPVLPWCSHWHRHCRERHREKDCLCPFILCFSLCLVHSPMAVSCSPVDRTDLRGPVLCCAAAPNSRTAFCRSVAPSGQCVTRDCFWCDRLIR